MNTIKQKLRSRTGASITFALLLFLVCAVLCSVILAASTAAAGRMSKIAETDQRYYSVTSAAEVLTDLIDGKTVSIVEVTVTPYTTTYSNGTQSGGPTPGTPVTSCYIVEEQDVTDSLLTDANKIGGSITIDSFPKDAAKSVYNGTPVANRSLTLTSAFSGAAGMEYDALSVAMRENIDTDGNISFTLYNKYKGKDASGVKDSESGSRYTLSVSFGADKNVTSGSKTEILRTETNADGSYTVYSQTTDTVITTLTWNLNGITTAGGGA